MDFSRAQVGMSIEPSSGLPSLDVGVGIRDSCLTTAEYQRLDDLSRLNPFLKWYISGFDKAGDGPEETGVRKVQSY
jgi:hypothetical protein